MIIYINTFCSICLCFYILFIAREYNVSSAAGAKKIHGFGLFLFLVMVLLFGWIFFTILAIVFIVYKGIAAIIKSEEEIRLKKFILAIFDNIIAY